MSAAAEILIVGHSVTKGCRCVQCKLQRTRNGGSVAVHDATSTCMARSGRRLATYDPAIVTCGSCRRRLRELSRVSS